MVKAKVEVPTRLVPAPAASSAEEGTAVAAEAWKGSAAAAAAAAEGGAADPPAEGADAGGDGSTAAAAKLAAEPLPPGLLTLWHRPEPSFRVPKAALYCHLHLPGKSRVAAAAWSALLDERLRP